MKAAYSSTLPEELMEELDQFAARLQIPKNRLIEMSVRDYLHKLRQAEYIRSFQQVGKDEDQMALADAGLEDYLNLLDTL